MNVPRTSFIPITFSRFLLIFIVLAHTGAIAAFKGRVLVGVADTLRLYELGKKKLLRKCEFRRFPNLVKTLHTVGDRIFVGDLQVSRAFLGLS